jgi:hypothetical protein
MNKSSSQELVNNDELRIVEAKSPLSAPPSIRAFPELKPHSKPNAMDAFETLRATRGAEAVIERVRLLGQPTLWAEVAYWGPKKKSGLARELPTFWGCDFPGNFMTLELADDNDVAFFAGRGREQFGDIQKPNALDGRVWCYMNTPAVGTYLFLTQFGGYLAEDFGMDHVSTVYFGINGETIGVRAMWPGGPAHSFVFVLNLSAGVNRFEINQHSNGMFFWSVTAFQIPESQTE